ncbi:MAG: HI0074 family nucleotidyltransferase substrate-binding subunit [Bacteroidetes bacterium]|nr:HI0074 family nucleotidyltransferase substrate-binding subunit [Bacteroidota bacterium]MCY4206136.1 HI0074 family nucleotidyltransferase substrate-binding subunit [Bacteroidota bacterium]
MIDYTKFRLSLKRLEEQYENYLHKPPTSPILDQEAVAESIIQRFEVCYECLWKVMKRYMTEELGIATIPSSPKPVLRLANENTLLSGSLAQWFRYANARINTSHDYDGEKAQDCISLIPDFIVDAIHLYETLTGEPWN